MYGNGSNAINAAFYAAQKNAAAVDYAGETTGEPTPDNGLVRLANLIEQATSRVESVAGNLGMLAVGIHGPRPEPVNNGVKAGIETGNDSFATRISHLMTAVDRLQRSYDSIVR